MTDVQSHDIGGNISADKVGETFYPRYRIVTGPAGAPVDVSSVTPLPTSLIGGGGIVTAPYDYISAAYPDSVTEVYTFKSGGSGGTTVSTVTVVYTTSGKSLIDSVTRS